MRVIQPVFVHGWAFGPDFWTPVVDALGWTDTILLDLGFMGQAHSASPLLAVRQLQVLQARGGAILGVGHSLGFLWLAQNLVLSGATRLAGINAFAAFAARESFVSGVPVRVLQRMLRGLSATPEKTVTDFCALCGAQQSVGLPNVPNLRLGLDWLLEGDVRPVLSRRAGQYRVLAGRQDPVVSTAMTEDSFVAEAGVQWVDGGHLLPQTDVQTCVAFLQATRKAMEQDAR